MTFASLEHQGCAQPPEACPLFLISFLLCLLYHLVENNTKSGGKAAVELFTEEPKTLQGFFCYYWQFSK